MGIDTNLLFEFLQENTERLDFVTSFNIIGSAAHSTRLAVHDEVDLYAILNSATPERIFALETLLGNASGVLGTKPLIESRRGPFRCRDSFQFHLIIDDAATVHDTSPITLADWARTAVTVKGPGLDHFINAKCLHKSFIKEVYKTLDMLATGHIQYKAWRFDGPRASLQHHSEVIHSLHSYCELLKYSYSAMRSDFISLGVPCWEDSLLDTRILEWIRDLRTGRLHRISTEAFADRARSWNMELLRLLR